MHIHPAYRVVAAEKLCGGVVVTFEDGFSAAFSAFLLRSALIHAEALCGLAKPELESSASGVMIPVDGRLLLPVRKALECSS